MVWFVIGVVYVLSVLGTRLAINVIEQDNDSEVTLRDFLVCVGFILCPVINTIMAFVGMFMLIDEAKKVSMNPSHVILKWVGLGSKKGIK